VLPTLGARYTMAGEREIHQRFAPADACLDDIFF
jgi:hypothetical protein